MLLLLYKRAHPLVFWHLSPVTFFLTDKRRCDENKLDCLLDESESAFQDFKLELELKDFTGTNWYGGVWTADVFDISYPKACIILKFVWYAYVFYLQSTDGAFV